MNRTVCKVSTFIVSITQSSTYFIMKVNIDDDRGIVVSNGGGKGLHVNGTPFESAVCKVVTSTQGPVYVQNYLNLQKTNIRQAIIDALADNLNSRTFYLPSGEVEWLSRES